MKKLTITITEQNGNRKNITVELENELADWLITQPEDVQRDFILFEYKAKCVERKETRRTQSLDSSLDNGFDLADESADNADTILTRLSIESALHMLPDEQRWVVEQHFLYGKSKTELAKIKGVSNAAIGQQITRATASLKKILTFLDSPV